MSTVSTKSVGASSTQLSCLVCNPQTSRIPPPVQVLTKPQFLHNSLSPASNSILHIVSPPPSATRRQRGRLGGHPAPSFYSSGDAGSRKKEYPADPSVRGSGIGCWFHDVVSGLALSCRSLWVHCGLFGSLLGSCSGRPVETAPDPTQKLK